MTRVLHEIHNKRDAPSNDRICMTAFLCRVEQFVSSNIHHAPATAFESLAVSVVGFCDCNIVGNFIGIEFSVGGGISVLSSGDGPAISDQITLHTTLP